MAANEIKINCTAKDWLDIGQLEIFQGNLKDLSKENYQRLRKQILEQGFISPIHVWKNSKGAMKILDGTQRVRTLQAMAQEGISIPKLPVTFIEAKTEKDARKILLSLVSQYGQVTGAGMYEFMSAGDLGMGDLEDFRIPELDLDRFDQEFFSDPEQTAKQDEIPEVDPNSVITKPGDLIELGLYYQCEKCGKEYDLETGKNMKGVCNCG